ncbi:hypothetical protein ACLKA7_001487 [Drosophila subpalustris]
MEVPVIRVNRDIEAGEAGVEVFRGQGNPLDKPTAVLSTEARLPRVVRKQVRKLGMKYDGQTVPLEFLELLEKRAITYGIALDRLPRAVSEIFVNKAARCFVTSGLRDVLFAATIF